MIDLPTIAESGTEFGPAMKALAPRHRAAVLAFCTTAGAEATEACRQAGYTDNKTGALKVTAHRIFRKPEVLAAIREVVLQNISMDLPVLHEALKKVAMNAQHKDQTKAILALMNRGGLPDVTERNINVNINVSQAEKIAEIRAMADELKLPKELIEAQLLGAISDAEFEEIPKGLEDVW
jgi:phage terminase small subunit